MPDTTISEEATPLEFVFVDTLPLACAPYRVQIAGLFRKAIDTLTASHAAELADARKELDDLKRILSDGTAVHLNMLYGKIAKPSKAQMLHVLGDQSLSSAEAERDELRAKVEELTAQKAALVAEHKAVWDKCAENDLNVTYRGNLPLYVETHLSKLRAERDALAQTVEEMKRSLEHWKTCESGARLMMDDARRQRDAALASSKRLAARVEEALKAAKDALEPSVFIHASPPQSATGSDTFERGVITDRAIIRAMQRAYKLVAHATAPSPQPTTDHE